MDGLKKKFEDLVPDEFKGYLKDPATIKVTDRHRKIAEQIINRNPELLREHVLSDFDWQAWLGKKLQSDEYEDLVTQDGDCFPCLYLDRKLWKSGDRVRVKLELVERLG